MEKQRLDRILASTGKWSRREAKLLVKQGRVLVDGSPAAGVEEKYDPAAVPITVDGQDIGYRRFTWLMMHKPGGVLSATEDGKGETVIDLLPPELRRLGLFPVGRLDKDTEGLLLLTDDGKTAHDLLSPRHHVDKVYYARTEGRLTPEDGPVNLAPLRRLTGFYILRRLKSDKSIIRDLPDKVELNRFCRLTKHQAVLYQQVVDRMRRELEAADEFQKKGVVLKSLMQFKQLCNHPAQYTGEGDFKAEESGKFLELAELAEKIAMKQEKVLVFTQFREMTDPLHELLSRVFGRPGLWAAQFHPEKSGPAGLRLLRNFYDYCHADCEARHARFTL